MTLRFGDERHSVAVDIGEGVPVESVAELFRPLLLSDRVGVPAPSALRVTRNGLTFQLESRGHGRDVLRSFASLPDLLSTLEHEIALDVMAGNRTDARVHAAGLTSGNAALLALGSSGAGKSSLALAWSVAGLAVLTDDVVLVDAEGRARGIPRLIKVDSRRLNAHGIPLDQTVAPVSDATEAWWDPQRGGGWARESLPVAVVTTIHFDPAENGATLSRLSPAEAFGALLRHVLPGGPELQDAADRFVRIAQAAHGFDVRFGSSADAAAALLSTLRGAR